MKRTLLAERDFLMFDPWDQLSGGDTQQLTFRKTSAHGVTLSIYGSIGTSDLTGKPTVEDMEVFIGDGEITNGLPERFLQELVDSILEEAA